MVKTLDMYKRIRKINCQKQRERAGREKELGKEEVGNGEEEEEVTRE